MIAAHWITILKVNPIASTGVTKGQLGTSISGGKVYRQCWPSA